MAAEWGAVYANQEWTSWTKSGEVIQQDQKDTVFKLAQSGGFKIGYGIADQLLLSISYQFSTLSSIGGAIAVFHKKTAPFLFLELVMSDTLYFPSGFPISSAAFGGPGGSVGIGYEFKKHFTIRANFSAGKHEYSGNDASNPVAETFQLYTTRADAKSTAYSLGITMSFLWY